MFQKHPLSEDMIRVLAFVEANPGKTPEEIKAGVGDVSHASLLCLLDDGLVVASRVGQATATYSAT